MRETKTGEPVRVDTGRRKRAARLCVGSLECRIRDRRNVKELDFEKFPKRRAVLAFDPTLLNRKESVARLRYVAPHDGRMKVVRVRNVGINVNLVCKPLVVLI